MTRRTLFALLVCASPALSLAQPVDGSCEYTSDKSAQAGLRYCTQVRGEDKCAAEAARKSSPEWLKAHPARFKAGGDCTDGGKALKKATAKKGGKADAKGSKKEKKQKQTETAPPDAK